MKDDTHTGVGIWPFIIDDPVFLCAAEWHDTCYMRDSWAQKNLSRKEVDEHFLQLMLVCCDTTAQRFRAHMYYRIVRIAGGFFWEGRP